MVIHPLLIYMLHPIPGYPRICDIRGISTILFLLFTLTCLKFVLPRHSTRYTSHPSHTYTLSSTPKLFEHPGISFEKTSSCNRISTLKDSTIVDLTTDPVLAVRLRSAAGLLYSSSKVSPTYLHHVKPCPLPPNTYCEPTHYVFQILKPNALMDLMPTQRTKHLGSSNPSRTATTNSCPRLLGLRPYVTIS